MRRAVLRKLDRLEVRWRSGLAYYVYSLGASELSGLSALWPPRRFQLAWFWSFTLATPFALMIGDMRRWGGIDAPVVWLTLSWLGLLVCWTCDGALLCLARRDAARQGNYVRGRDWLGIIIVLSIDTAISAAGLVFLAWFVLDRLAI